MTFFCVKAFSAVFVVTSNADSGPGTLREALTFAAANGSTTQDFIQFNISDTSKTGRTIIISTDLPNLSSNLVIDASTQPGAKFGISDAKIKLVARITDTNYNITLTTCFNIDFAQDIEIYGFLFDWINATSRASSSIHSIGSRHATNLIIGAPGKGNILKTTAGIALSYQTSETDVAYNRNVKISSNIFGISENNVNLADTGGMNISASRVVNLTLGGFTPAEGNKFSSEVAIEEDDNVSVNIHTGNLLVAYNSFGADITGTKNFTNNRLGSALNIGCYYLSSAQISNNLFIGYTSMGLNVNCFFKLTGNKFGTDITGTHILGTTLYQLVLGYCGGGGIIGGTNPGDGNIFAGAFQQSKANSNGGVIIATASPGVELVGNSFKCNNSNRPYDLELVGSEAYFVKITNRKTNSISGTATPNSRVDLYYSLTCDHCEPEMQFTSITANANGNWIYSGILSNNNIIASSTFNGTTSEFTTLRFTNQPTDVKIKMICNGQKGSITGLSSNDLTSYTWYDINNNVVSNKKDLINVSAGTYHLIISDGYCVVSSELFEIKDASNQIDVSHEAINFSSCNKQDGSIFGIVADPASSFNWTNSAGSIVGYSQNLTNVAAGSYMLTVITSDGSCSQTIGPIVVKNTTGPNIDQSKAVIQSTNCGQSTGSIINVTATGTGTLIYSWTNAQQQQVGTDANLVNQSGGIYKLQVTDDTKCGPVYSTLITIPETNGIALDESKAQTTVANCSVDNGSITGIQITGATKYQWTNAQGNTTGTEIDLKDVPSGDYTLRVSNNFGCTGLSKSYHITQQAPTQFPNYLSTITPACTGIKNGAVSVTVDGLVKKQRWVNSESKTIGISSEITNIAEGTYQFYLTDQNGCESFYATYIVTSVPQLQIKQGSEQITNDQCTVNAGSIKNVEVSGGKPPYTYSWLDANNNKISSSLDVTGLSEGSYTLNVNDATTCGIISAVYSIKNENSVILAPLVDNLQICSPGEALLQVTNPQSKYSYRLYDSETSLVAIDQQASGNFKINVKANESLYVSQVFGSCESSRSVVLVSVGLSGIDIANAFTPNGDGINDYWKITGIQSYPDATIQVLNRYGQKVFESKGYPHPFDGTMKGKNLPVGAYYYIIKLNTKCNLISGSLTIIR